MNDPADVTDEAKTGEPGLVTNEVVQDRSIEPTEHDLNSKKHPKTLKLLIILLVIVAAAGAALYFFYYQKGSTTSSPLKSIQSNNLSGVDKLVSGYTFVRYKPNSEYSKYLPDDIENSVRADSFQIQLVRNGVSHQITLGKNIFDFGRSLSGGFYALGCTPVQDGSVGAENQDFSITFYGPSGNVVLQQSFEQRSASAPFAGSDSSIYCTDAFNVSTDFNVSPSLKTGFGQQKIDDLNYDIYVLENSQKREVARETSRIVDIPLAMSPDSKTFFYNQVSAKRYEISCVGEVKLPYKIPDYDGSVNDLHMVNLVTGEDKNLGSEQSFSTESYPISLSSPGTFMPNGARYYLQFGTHVGCSGDINGPIHLPYINVPSGAVGAITSQKSLGYNSTCFSPRGDYVLLYKDNYDKGGSTTSPTVVNLSNSSEFRMHASYAGFDDSPGCNYNQSGADVFVAPLPVQNYSSGDQSSYVISKIRVLDPSTDKVRDIKLDKPIQVGDSFVDDIHVFQGGDSGYVSLSSRSGDGAGPVIFFDSRGHIKVAPSGLMVF